MKTAAEFYDRIRSDEAFADEISKKAVEWLVKEGDQTAALIAAASECGYEIKAEDIASQIEAEEGELSAEELNKVAGGTAPVRLSINTLTVSVFNSAGNKGLL